MYLKFLLAACLVFLPLSSAFFLPVDDPETGPGTSPGTSPGRNSDAPVAAHPGCSIWWFVPGCPLGNLFGTDPFRLYPWADFCRRYEDFKSIPECNRDKEQNSEKVVNGNVIVPHKQEAEADKSHHDIPTQHDISSNEATKEVEMTKNPETNEDQMAVNEKPIAMKEESEDQAVIEEKPLLMNERPILTIKDAETVVDELLKNKEVVEPMAKSDPVEMIKEIMAVSKETVVRDEPVAVTKEAMPVNKAKNEPMANNDNEPMANMKESMTMNEPTANNDDMKNKEAARNEPMTSTNAKETVESPIESTDAIDKPASSLRRPRRHAQQKKAEKKCKTPPCKIRSARQAEDNANLNGSSPGSYVSWMQALYQRARDSEAVAQIAASEPVRTFMEDPKPSSLFDLLDTTLKQVSEAAQNAREYLKD